MAAVETAGYTAGHPVRLYALAYFAQEPRPATLKVAGLTSVVPWTARVTVIGPPGTGAIVSFGFKTQAGAQVTVNRTTLVGETAADIAAAFSGLLATAAAGVLTVTYTATMAYFDVQAATGTLRFQVNILSEGLTYLDTEADSAYAARLSALVLVDPDFYVVGIDSTSDANTTAVAAWVQANDRIFVARTQNTRERDTPGGGALAIALRDATYNRTELRFNYRGESANAALGAIILANSWDNGTAPTLAFRNLKGITVDALTPTHVANMQTAVNVSIFVRERGANITWQGKSAAGDYLDLRVFLDWLDARMGEAVYNLLLAEPRVPYTTEGIGKIGNKVWGVIEMADARGAVSPDYPKTLTLPKPAEVSIEERTTRILGGGGIGFAFVYVGAVHKVRVRGVVTL